MSPQEYIKTHLIGVEGGYVNDPSDSGGETIWGITKNTAVANGYTGAMKDITKDQAADIYYKAFFLANKLDLIYDVDPVIAFEILDTVVNTGSGTKWLQEILNACNNIGTLYPDITVDGKYGNQTVAAMKALYSKRGESQASKVLLIGLNAKQFNYYLDLVQRREKDEKFFWGWITNRVVAQL